MMKEHNCYSRITLLKFGEDDHIVNGENLSILYIGICHKCKNVVYNILPADDPEAHDDDFENFKIYEPGDLTQFFEGLSEEQIFELLG